MEGGKESPRGLWRGALQMLTSEAWPPEPWEVNPTVLSWCLVLGWGSHNGTTGRVSRWVWGTHRPGPCTPARKGLASPHLRDGSQLQTWRTCPRSHKVTRCHLCSGHMALGIRPWGLHLPGGLSWTLCPHGDVRVPRNQPWTRHLACADVGTTSSRWIFCGDHPRAAAGAVGGPWACRPPPGPCSPPPPCSCPRCG